MRVSVGCSHSTWIPRLHRQADSKGRGTCWGREPLTLSSGAVPEPGHGTANQLHKWWYVICSDRLLSMAAIGYSWLNSNSLLSVRFHCCSVLCLLYPRWDVWNVNSLFNQVLLYSQTLTSTDLNISGVARGYYQVKDLGICGFSWALLWPIRAPLANCTSQCHHTHLHAFSNHASGCCKYITIS